MRFLIKMIQISEGHTVYYTGMDHYTTGVIVLIQLTFVANLVLIQQ